MERNLVGNWNYPTMIRFGAGRIGELPGVCGELGMARPLLVTDPGLARLQIVKRAVDSCRAAGLGCGLFENIRANPTGENVSDGLRFYRSGGYDGVIGFGGGSAMDAGKAIAFMVGQSGEIWEFEDVGDNWRRAKVDAIPPVIAVPTTAGTGSEVGRAAVILDTEARIKRVIFHPRMLPSVVIADPALTLGLPKDLTAATGMDALSHNLEAYCAPVYHPMAEGIAAEGIRLVREWLPVAYADGGNIIARSHMMAASTLGATAFQRGLGAMHALAHPLGGLYDAHHGLLNAVLMPYVLLANRKYIGTQMARLARYLDLPGSGFRAVLDWVLDLRRGLEIPENLAKLGIEESCPDRVGRMAAADPSSQTNPFSLGAADYSRILGQAIRGEMELGHRSRG